MLSFAEIEAMSPEQIAAMNRKLAVRLVLTRIVAPVVAIVAVQVVANVLERRFDKKNENN
jgi:hypothetical protein